MTILSSVLNLTKLNWKKILFGLCWTIFLRKFLLWRKKTLEIYKIALALPHEPIPESISHFSLDLSGIFKRNFSNGFKSTNEITKEMIPFLVKQSKKFKDDGLFLIWLANYKLSPIPICTIHITDIKLAKEMMKAKYNGIFEKGRPYEVVECLIGKGVAAVHFNNWKYQRNIIEKGFSDEMMKLQFPSILKTSKELIQRIDSLSVDMNTSIDVINQIQRASLDILGRVAFSHEIGSLKMTGNEKAPLHSALDFILDVLAQRVFFPVKQLLSILPLKENREFNKRVEIINEIVSKILQDRKTKCLKEDPKDLLDILLSNNKLSDQLIVDNIKTLLFAGQDTTAATITWAIYLLCKDRDIYKKLQNEIDSLSVDYSIDDIEELEYLNAFLLEVMRLYPVAGTIRRTKESVQLGKYMIPPGIDIFCLFYIPQRDEKYYSEPDKCVPERWIKTNEESINLQSRIGKIIREPNQAYGPFSLGHRNCVGRKLALLEMRVILIEIMKNFEIIPTKQGKDFQEIPYLTITKVPRGFHAIFKKKSCET